MLPNSGVKVSVLLPSNHLSDQVPNYHSVLVVPRIQYLQVNNKYIYIILTPQWFEMLVYIFRIKTLQYLCQTLLTLKICSAGVLVGTAILLNSAWEMPRSLASAPNS